MSSTIQRLKDLEAKIFAADGHEGRKYYHQMQEELYLAWPEILALVEAAERYSHTDSDEDCVVLLKSLAALNSQP